MTKEEPVNLSNESIVRKQLEEAIENGKYRILIHRTATKNATENEPSTVEDVFKNGLKSFGGNNISYTTSDYRNDMDLILQEIENSSTYKGSDTVFILKIPVNGLDYQPFNVIPILHPSDEKSKYGDKCYVIDPKYVLGYVETSPKGISTLHYNKMARTLDESDLTYTSSIEGKYRKSKNNFLYSIVTDRYYTDDEKRWILNNMYIRKDVKLSNKLKKMIERLGPESHNAVNWEIMEPYYIVNNMMKQLKEDKAITYRMVKKLFSTLRLVTNEEINDTMTTLLNKENELKRSLLPQEIVQSIAEINGFDTDKVLELNGFKQKNKKSFIERLKMLFNKKTETPLLTEGEQKGFTGRNKFIEEIQFDVQGKESIKDNANRNENIKGQTR